MVASHQIGRLIDQFAALSVADVSARRIGIYRCRRIQRLTQLVAHVPKLMIPLAGAKHILVAEQRYEASAGEFLIVPAGVEFEVHNLPEAHSGRYLGAALEFDDETIGLFRTLYGAELERWRLEPQWKAPADAEFLSAISEWVERNRAFPADAMQTRHRMAELLLIIARQGLAGNLLFPQGAQISLRTKHLLMLDPAKSWRISDVAEMQGVSESTFRRRLRGEGVSFRDLLEETRLNHGAELLMTTDAPISQVAFQCGYQSQSRFAERFRLRFSLSPTELRATQQAADDDDAARVISLTERLPGRDRA